MLLLLVQGAAVGAADRAGRAGVAGHGHVLPRGVGRAGARARRAARRRQSVPHHARSSRQRPALRLNCPTNTCHVSYGDYNVIDFVDAFTVVLLCGELLIFVVCTVDKFV